MLVVEARFHHLDALEVWWPPSAEAVVPLVSAAPVVTVVQCSAIVADALAPFTFRRRVFPTTIIDLSLPEGTLWSRLDQKSCRTEINRARRLECTVSVNTNPDDALRLINGLIQRSEYRRPTTAEEWKRHLEYSDVFVVYLHGEAIATHVVCVDGTDRARVLLGATVERGARYPGGIIGALNRYLLWHEIGHYHDRGVGRFDFGGITLDRQSPLYSIARFKLSFGGDVIEEYVVRLAGLLPLRLSLRAAARAKGWIDRWNVRQPPAVRPAQQVVQ